MLSQRSGKIFSVLFPTCVGKSVPMIIAAPRAKGGSSTWNANLDRYFRQLSQFCKKVRARRRKNKTETGVNPKLWRKVPRSSWNLLPGAEWDVKVSKWWKGLPDEGEIIKDWAMPYCSAASHGDLPCKSIFSYLHQTKDCCWMCLIPVLFFVESLWFKMSIDLAIWPSPSLVKGWKNHLLFIIKHG